MSIVNIPVGSKNADTLDGKHADEFAPSGFGLGSYSRAVGTDWNNYTTTGFYHGRNLPNQPPTPDGTNGLWYVLAIKYTDDRWCTQIAFNFDNLHLNYIRKKINNTWSQWTKINDGGIADTIKNTLPINKGGTGATSVVNALKNLNLLNHNISNVPSCSPLVYKNYTDFGINSMTMHNFIRQIPEHSFFVFENNKNAVAYIIDAPYNLGVIYAFRGYVHDGHALFFSGQGDNGSIYHFLCNRDVILQNWTKINDGGNALTLNGKQLSDLIQKYGVILNKDANDIRTSGEYYFQGGTNVPDSPVGHYGWLKVEEGYNVNYLKQIYTPINGTSYVYQRFLVNGVWNNWTKIGDSCNALTLNNHEDSYFATAAQMTNANNALNNKIDKVSGKGLSTNDFTAAYKTKLDGIANGAKANVQSDWNVTATNSDAFIKNKPTSLPANGGNADTVDGKHASDFATAAQMTTANNTLNNKVDKVSGKGLSENDFTYSHMVKLAGIQTGAEINVQSDWNIADTKSDAFIKNKPTSFPANGGNADTVDGKHASEFATTSQVTTINTTLNNKVDKVSGKGLSTNDFTAAYKTKLDGIANGAKDNVQSDWNITDTSSDAFIKNKPQNLVNKTELPTMCPQGFYKEYLSVSLESNSYYKIALDGYRSGNGIFVLDVISDKSVIYESHVVFSVSSALDTFALDTIEATSKINVLTHGFNKPALNKILIGYEVTQTTYLAIRTADFKAASPIDARIHINFIGREYKTYDTIEKVEIPQKRIVFELDL